MPTLLELQRAMRTSLVERDDRAAAAMLADGVAAARLNIYRNTFIMGATRALRLSYPAVQRLVGADFFEGAASEYIAQAPPRAGSLDDYGASFPQFLRQFGPARSLAYLADVACLEWAVSRAIHARDVEPLDLSHLSDLSSEQQAQVVFVAHPAVTLLSANHPVDDIWRGVLGGNDAALAAVDLDAGPVHLLVERRATGVEVTRLDEAAWCFAGALCDGQPIAMACAAAPGVDAAALLAEHLAAGRFIGFHLADAEAPPLATGSPEVPI
jgi:hypothetical protein